MNVRIQGNGGVGDLPGTPLPGLASLKVLEIAPEAAREGGIVTFKSRDVDSRPFNLLRTQVSKKCAEHGWSIIGVSSPAPASGKSFIAANLAVALSRVGDNPVYLFDLDMCRGSIATAFGLEVKLGLSDYLAGKVDDLAEIGLHVKDSNLAIFPTQRTNANTADLLSGERFEALIAAMRATGGDAIMLCDLPPAFANDDAMIAVQHSDAFLMIVDGGKTTRKQLTEAISMFQPTPMLGTVLNRYSGGFVDPYGYGSYSRAYRKYY